MRKYLIILGLSILLISCNSGVAESLQIETPSKIFWNELMTLEGRTFEGQLVSSPVNDDFAGKKLVMSVLYCDDETILIPFNVGDNLSRTWVFKYQNGRIELKHDHRMENGENDEITMYGALQLTKECQICKFFQRTKKQLI